MTEVGLELRSSHVWPCNMFYLGSGFLSHLPSPGRSSQNSGLAKPQAPIWFICQWTFMNWASINLALKSCILKRQDELTKITNLFMAEPWWLLISSWAAAQVQAVAAMKSRLHIWLQILALPLPLWSWAIWLTFLTFHFLVCYMEITSAKAFNERKMTKQSWMLSPCHLLFFCASSPPTTRMIAWK